MSVGSNWWEVKSFIKQDHTVQRRSCKLVPGGARLHDYWQQASKRGAAKEVILFGIIAQMATGNARAPITAARAR